jgi:hypothetical protein
MAVVKFRGRGTFSGRRRSNATIAPPDPFIMPRAPITFTEGPLATPVEGFPGSAGELKQLLEKLPALVSALGFTAPPPAGQPSKVAGYYAAFALRLASEFVPGFRNACFPIPFAAKKSKHGKTAADEKTALMYFDVIRKLTKTDREAWAAYAANVLDSRLKSPHMRDERNKIGRNLEIRMSPLVAARRQKAKAGRPQ